MALAGVEVSREALAGDDLSRLTTFVVEGGFNADRANAARAVRRNTARSAATVALSATYMSAALVKIGGRSAAIGKAGGGAATATRGSGACAGGGSSKIV